MSVEITFEHDGSLGLVAEGCYLWDAARRMGVSLTTDCSGRGECDTCAVIIAKGAELLSAATDAERKNLGADRLRQGQRLACQTKIAKTGQVTVGPAPPPEPASAQSDERDKFRKQFRHLTFNQKVGALIELEAIAMTEALNTVRDTSRGFVAKVLNLKERNKKDE